MTLKDEVHAYTKTSLGKRETNEFLNNCVSEIKEFLTADKVLGLCYTSFGKGTPFYNVIRNTLKTGFNVESYFKKLGYNCSSYGDDNDIIIYHKEPPKCDFNNEEYLRYIYSHKVLDRIYASAYDGKTKCKITYYDPEIPIRNNKMREYIQMQLIEDGFDIVFENHQSSIKNHKLIISW